MALVRTPNKNVNPNSVGGNYGDRRVRAQTVAPAPLPAQKPLDKFAGVGNRKAQNLEQFAAKAQFNQGKRFAGVGAPYRPFMVDAIERGYAVRNNENAARPTDTQMLNFLDRIISTDAPRAKAPAGTPVKAQVRTAKA